MEISVKKAQTGVYSISLNGTVHTLSTRELKVFLLEAVKALVPGALPTLSPREETHELATRLKTANNPGLQKLIMQAGDDEILIFLKCTENDVTLHEKLFANMSERKHKMFLEDLQYHFTTPISDDALNSALTKLMKLINELQNDGILAFDDM